MLSNFLKKIAIYAWATLSVVPSISATSVNEIQKYPEYINRLRCAKNYTNKCLEINRLCSRLLLEASGNPRIRQQKMDDIEEAIRFMIEQADYVKQASNCRQRYGDSVKNIISKLISLFHKDITDGRSLGSYFDIFDATAKLGRAVIRLRSQNDPAHPIVKTYPLDFSALEQRMAAEPGANDESITRYVLAKLGRYLVLQGVRNPWALTGNQGETKQNILDTLAEFSDIMSGRHNGTPLIVNAYTKISQGQGQSQELADALDSFKNWTTNMPGRNFATDDGFSNNVGVGVVSPEFLTVYRTFRKP